MQDGVIQDQIPTVGNVAPNEAGVNRDAARQVHVWHQDATKSCFLTMRLSWSREIQLLVVWLSARQVLLKVVLSWAWTKTAMFARLAPPVIAGSSNLARFYSVPNLS
jgi:hypothetical protein